MSEVVLIENAQRDRTRFVYGPRHTYDDSNRLGDGTRPGREDYSVMMAHDSNAVEPELDWSDAHIEIWESLVKNSHESKGAQELLLIEDAFESEGAPEKEVARG